MKTISMRDAFFDRLYVLARKDPDIMIVTADMGAPSLDKFRDNLAKQFVNVGIAEANMVTVAAGLALGGKKVFIYAIMPFVTTRCYEMLKLELSLMKLPITAVGIGSGFSYDDSGPTHHSTEDISIMRVLPDMTIWNSTDSVMARELPDMACALQGPSYIRLDRKIFPDLYRPGEDLSAGLKQVKKGRDICIIATGNMAHSGLRIAAQLAKGPRPLDAGVVDLYRLKPVNVDCLLGYIARAEKIVTLEEHLLAGGMGSAVAEALADAGRTMPLKRFGVQDKYYYAYGGRQNIQALCRLDDETIVRSIRAWA